VRGYGHIKAASAARAAEERERMIARFRDAAAEPELEAAE
jgi:indolepyruvate ferredoxin oxidoreductase